MEKRDMSLPGCVSAYVTLPCPCYRISLLLPRWSFFHPDVFMLLPLPRTMPALASRPRTLRTM
eukprot:951499-Pyramimonas_sp.AAC.1